MYTDISCFRYHKGTDFQANHNGWWGSVARKCVVLDTTKVLIFKQITTAAPQVEYNACCFRYHKGTDFQANHNYEWVSYLPLNVVLDTTKVLIFKQITTRCNWLFSNKRCFRYHKGTDFQANHNRLSDDHYVLFVVLDTTKVLIFKQITTTQSVQGVSLLLF